MGGDPRASGHTSSTAFGRWRARPWAGTLTLLALVPVRSSTACGVLADQKRRRLFKCSAGASYPPARIVGEFAISAPAISQYLKVLREAKLVAVQVEA